MRRLAIALTTAALVASLGASTAFATHEEAQFVDSIDGQGAGEFSGTLTNPSTADSADWYCFSGTAGTAVTIAMSSEDFDSHLILYSVAGSPAPGDDRTTYTVVAANDDSGDGTLNSLIEISLPTTGNYMVAAESLSNWDTALGAYNLSIAGSVSPCGSLELDDTARGSADRVRVTGTLTCPAGEVFLVEVTLTQDGTTGSGRARGTCTGEPQTFSAGIGRTSGSGFVTGPAEACATASNAAPGSRTVSDSVQTCESVTIVP